MEILINISVGELIDKITILQIKKEKISDLEKVKKVSFELEILENSLNSFKTNELKVLMDDLKEINQKLWTIEDDIRLLEKNKQFDKNFINLARSVYITNDQRFEVKNKINKLFLSDIEEVKSYEEY